MRVRDITWQCHAASHYRIIRSGVTTIKEEVFLGNGNSRICAREFLSEEKSTTVSSCRNPPLFPRPPPQIFKNSVGGDFTVLATLLTESSLDDFER